VVSPRG
jgi:hypothetical protein